jgi:hypothetical protein
MELVTTWIRAVLTAALLILVSWWLVVIGTHITSAATKGSDGQVLDPFQRAKDILLVVLPLLTTALGYWFGAAGKATAEAASQNAQGKLAAVLDTSSEPGLLAAAREKHPDAFPARAKKQAPNA